MLKQISILFVIIFSSSLVLAQQEQPQQINKPLKILSRKGASYTKESLDKRVGGIIILKVTFQANGEIGLIEYVSESSKKKKLTKYGLVASAIEAAKQITFEPEIVDGKAVTVTKRIEYSFLVPPKGP